MAGAGPDLFGHVEPAKPQSRAKDGVNYTPAFLARSLAEHAIWTLGDLAKRKTLAIADYACGSGAFLVEALRALERRGFNGKLRLIGRDLSPTAIHMARFALGLAIQDWPGRGRAEMDLTVADALGEIPLPKADLIVMNPPFANWEQINADRRARLIGILGPEAKGRPDESLAFVSRAVEALNPGGAIAAILPANTLISERYRGWRERISDGRVLALKAILDNLNIFRPAIVRVGAIVITSNATIEPVAIRLPSDASALSRGLRALRRLSLGNGLRAVMSFPLFIPSPDQILHAGRPLVVPRPRSLSCSGWLREFGREIMVSSSSRTPNSKHFPRVSNHISAGW